MDAFGGNDEESVELRKLLAEVVRTGCLYDGKSLSDGPCRTMILTALKFGRNLCARASRWKAA